MSPAAKDDLEINEPCNLSFDGLRSLSDEVVIALYLPKPVGW